MKSEWEEGNKSTQQRKLNIVHLTSENFPTSHISRNQLKSASDDGIDNKLSDYSKDSNNDHYMKGGSNQIQSQVNKITLSEAPKFQKMQIKVKRNQNNFGNVNAVNTIEPTQIQLITTEQSQDFKFNEHHRSSTMIVDTRIETKDWKISDKDSYDDPPSSKSYFKRKSMIEPKAITSRRGSVIRWSYEKSQKHTEVQSPSNSNWQYVNLNIKEEIILNQPVNNVKIVTNNQFNVKCNFTINHDNLHHRRNKKLVVYNSQKYTKYKNASERAKEKYAVEDKTVNGESYTTYEDYDDSDFEDSKGPIIAKAKNIELKHC